MSRCQAKGCNSEAIEDFCSYHEELSEDGVVIERKTPAHGRDVLNLTKAEKAKRYLQVLTNQRESKHRRFPNMKHRELKPQTEDELAAKYDKRRKQERDSRAALKYQPIAVQKECARNATLEVLAEVKANREARKAALMTKKIA